MLETLVALAEPNRLRIVELLREKPYAVGELSESLNVRQPQVSKHLKVLGEAGLVGMRADGQRRIYHLQAQPLQDLDSWVESFRKIWEKNFEGLDALLAEMKAAEARRQRAQRKED